MSTPQNQLTDQLQSSLDQDTADLTRLAEENKPEPFTEKPPEHDVGIYSRMPYLIGLAALGGKFSKLHARTMLSATNGMVQGMMKGDQAAYQEHEKKYNDAYQRWLDKFTVQQRLFAEMRQVFKGRIDADLKALEFARKTTNDEARVTQQDVKNHLEAERLGVQLKDVNSKIEQRQAAAQTAANREARLAEKDAGNATKKGEEKTRAVTLIDELTTMLDDDKSPVSLTGAGGKVRRLGETAGNVLGITDETSAHDFESKLEELRLMAPKLVTGSSKSAKDERERIEKVARGLKLGDTKQNTLSALKSLRESIASLKDEAPKDKFEVGKVYQNPKGERAEYLGNGKWKPLPKT